MRRFVEWLSDLPIWAAVGLFLGGPALLGFIGFLAYSLFFSNPVVDQVPVAEPVVVEAERSCSTAYGPCQSCQTDAQGNYSCATMTFGSCPGRLQVRETRQDMLVERKKGEPKVETFVPSVEPVTPCESQNRPFMKESQNRADRLRNPLRKHCSKKGGGKCFTVAVCDQV